MVEPLSQQIRKLAGEADAAFAEAMASVDRGDRQDQIDEHRGLVAVTHDRLAIVLMENRATILAALELAEHMEAPGCVEEVARVAASALGDNFDDAFANKQAWIDGRGQSGGRFRDVNEPRQSDYLDAAQAAISAMKGERG